MRCLTRSLLVLGLLLGGVTPHAVAAGAAVTLAGHRAIYEIGIGRADHGGSVVAIRGRLAVEVLDACDGHTTTQRFWTELLNAEGETVVSDFTLSSWEAKDGSTFRFEMRNILNGEPSDEFAGSASVKDGEGGTARMLKPAEATLDLPKGTVFPNQHVVQVIRQAIAGARFASIRIFDGSGEDGSFETGVTIGREMKAEAGDDPVLAPLKDLRSWPVRMAFFPLKTKAEEPQYEIGFRLFENGVSGDIVLDYGEYSMKGTLRQLEMLPGGC